MYTFELRQICHWILKWQWQRHQIIPTEYYSQKWIKYKKKIFFSFLSLLVGNYLTKYFHFNGFCPKANRKRKLWIKKLLSKAVFMLDSWWLVGRYNMFQCKYTDCIALEPFIMRVNRCSWREFNFFLLLLISNSILSIKCAQLSCNSFHFDFSYICSLFLFLPVLPLYKPRNTIYNNTFIHILFTVCIASLFGSTWMLFK